MFKRAVSVLAAEAAVLSRQREHIKQTAVAKLQSLSVEADERLQDLDTLSQELKDGHCGTTELLHGVKNGQLSTRDLLALNRDGVLSSSSLHRIQRQLHGGSARLSMTEILVLFNEKLMGKEEMVMLMKRGDLRSKDIEDLVQRELLPKDVAEVIEKETKEMDVEIKEGTSGYAEIKELLASKQLPDWKLAPFVMLGDLHPDDVALLVEEGVLSKERGEDAISESATAVAEVYEEVEKLAELVSDERFTFEELEVMRAKGVLGDHLVHHLVLRVGDPLLAIRLTIGVCQGAIHDSQGRHLLAIEEDAAYMDPEKTDDEIETPPSQVSPASTKTHQISLDEIIGACANMTKSPTEASAAEPTVMSTERLTETPAAKLTEGSTEPPVEMSTEGSTETPAVKSTEGSTETPAVKSTEGSTEPPAEMSTEGSTETPAEMSTEGSTETPAEMSTEGLTEPPAEMSVKATTEASTEKSTDTPTEDPTESSPEIPILERGGASDEGFYPVNIDRDDTFTLWEYLSEIYSNRPGTDATLIDRLDSVVKSRRPQAAVQKQEQTKGLQIAPLDSKGQAVTEGKRKSAIASVTLRKGEGNILVNNQPFRDYFPNMDGRCYVLSPFFATETLGMFDAEVTVKGGGWSGQAQAIRHGISKALISFDPEKQEKLRTLGLLTRDTRRVERKKPGKAKARKSFQWVKR